MFSMVSQDLWQNMAWAPFLLHVPVVVTRSFGHLTSPFPFPLGIRDAFVARWHESSSSCITKMVALSYVHPIINLFGDHLSIIMFWLYLYWFRRFGQLQNVTFDHNLFEYPCSAHIHHDHPSKQVGSLMLIFIFHQWRIDRYVTHTQTDIMPSKWCDQSQCLQIVLLHLVWIWVVISRVISGCAKETRDLVAFQGSLPHGGCWFKSFGLKVSFKRQRTRPLCQHNVNAKSFQKYENKHNTILAYNS